MLKLTINNSICTLAGFNRAQFDIIRQIMSYKETTYSKFKGFGYKPKFLFDKKGNFPSGLLYLLEGAIAKYNWPVQRVQNRKRPKIRAEGSKSLFIDGRCPIPYPEQLIAANTTRSIKDGKGVIVAPTGTGKSLIIALICDQLQVPTIILVPSLALKTQTISTLSHYFGKDKVGPLGEDGIKKYFITIENYDALNPNKVLEGFNCLIIDEFHHSGSSSLQKISEKAAKNIYFRYGLTATPVRSKSEEKILLEAVIAPVIYRIEYKTAVEKGYINPIELYYYKLSKVKLIKNSQNYAEVYSDLIVNRQDRNELIVDLIASLHNQNKSTLVLVKQINHGEKLQSMLKERGLDIPFANGLDSNSRIHLLEFNLREKPVLIGSAILGEGVDTKPCEYVILAGGVGKSKGQLMQNLGRAFRNHESKQSGKIIMFAESSHRWFIEHTKAFFKTVEDEYSLTPIELKL